MKNRKKIPRRDPLYKAEVMRCDVCGKFIGGGGDDSLVSKFIPDTLFTSESISYRHVDCHKKLIIAKARQVK